jgi:hypothetical protein
MINPYELTIQELEQLILDTPATSACARAQIEQYQAVLNSKKQALSTGDN